MALDRVTIIPQVIFTHISDKIPHCYGLDRVVLSFTHLPICSFARSNTSVARASPIAPDKHSSLLSKSFSDEEKKSFIKWIPDYQQPQKRPRPQSKAWKIPEAATWRHDIQHDDTQQNEIQHTNNWSATLSLMTHSIMALNAECCHAKGRLWWVSFMASVDKPIKMSVILPNVVILSVVMQPRHMSSKRHFCEAPLFLWKLVWYLGGIWKQER